MIADTSGGCEPEFSLIWFKNVMDGEHLPYVLDYFIEVAKAEGFWREDLLDRILDNHGSVKGLDQVPVHWQRVFVTSHDISTDWHIKMQAAFQEFSDSAVSKTINLPTDATVEDAKRAYLLAYQLGCKGITVYRDGSREEQVLNLGVSNKAKQTGVGEEASKPLDGEMSSPKVKPRPYKRAGVTLSRETPFGTAHITMNHDEEGPAEVFITIGRAGSDVMAMAEGYGRSISLYLRTPSHLSRGEKVQELVDQLRGIGGARSIGFGEARVSSLPDAIARALAEHWLNDAEIPVQKSLDKTPVSPSKPGGNGGNGRRSSVILTGNLCPECGMLLAREEGCQKCYFCGYSEC
jgi:ribonucleoside-diphosphate reductase alpha chain